ncbi:hypothetical protein HHL17_08465 [Chitinophaga sp. G-6-1-13]|uniref:Uncharacterized protein n=1 Tax=Chitinophaga fulva TaxID=2728842 RepID=A0A848GKK0_9BACT|nr:hypothetical protein [Chitinophaga fulva]NML37230.1 hypothetical protein [Chitinophaga fulva]
MKPLLFLMMIIGLIPYQANSQTSSCLSPHLSKGDTLANIYSRTIAMTGEGFAPLVFRISGSSAYKVTDGHPARPAFMETDLYDGRPENRSATVIGLDGNNIWQDKPYANTSASGLMYNSLIWGQAPAQLHEGDTWKHTISVPWELGGPGTQTITVMALDNEHQTVTLKREGYSEGFYDNDAKQMDIATNDGKKLRVTVKPGTSHWTGYTTFRQGIVISDALLVTRPVLLTSDEQHFSGQQRQYILLNAMPYLPL